jgi:predicted PurR-regulated permease PerM
VLGFGIIGLFVGPVLLAVTWTLLVTWVGDIDRVPEARESEGKP